MPLFSESNGYRKPIVPDPESLSDSARARIWNILDQGPLRLAANTAFGRGPAGDVQGKQIRQIAISFNHQVTKQVFDSIAPSPDKCKAFLREQVLAGLWHGVYDLLQDIYSNGQSHIAQEVNQVLEQEGAGFLWNGKHFVPIISPEEAIEIELAAKSSPTVQTHLEEAMKLLSDKSSTDFRNSVKESISAVESACKEVCGDPKATLGDALKKIAIHSALQKAYSALYGYTSDGDGIRHCLSAGDQPVSRSTARYFLVSCSAFINLISTEFNQSHHRSY